MKCKNCGEELIEGQNFCSNCGNGVGEYKTPKRKKKGNKKKKIIISAVVVILFIIAIGSGGEETSVSTDKQNTETTETTSVQKATEVTESTDAGEKDVSESKESTTKNKELTDKEKEKIIKRINDNVYEDDYSTWDIISMQSDCTENQFYEIWSELLYAIISESAEPDYVHDDICDYCDLYMSVWEESEKINKIKELSEKLEEGIKQSDKLVQKIGFDSDRRQVYSKEFYITQKLEEDNVSAIIDKLQPTEARNEWVAYDVEYSILGAIPGDNACVLSTPKSMTFPERGVYYLSYITTFDNTTLVDSSGFSEEVSVLFVLADQENIEADIYSKSLIDSDNLYYFESIKDLLQGKEVEENQKYKYKDAAPDWVFEGSVALPYKVRAEGSTLNIRAGCGTEYDVVGSLEDGCDIAVLETYEGWSYIVGSYGVDGWVNDGEYREIYGWVNRDYIEVIPYSP